MKGMRAKFTNKRGRPRQRPAGRIITLISGLNGSLNNKWRIR